MLFNRNKPNHTLLLMPVRLANEHWPKNKVRILSCDAEGNLFTQLLGRSTYQRIKKEVEQMEAYQKQYATVYWDNGESRFIPLYVEIGEKEVWALERIMEHAIRNAVIPHVLKNYPKEIIKLGEIKYQGLLAEKSDKKRKSVTSSSSRVLERLPYYREEDIEVSIPLYKAENSFPLIVLKLLPETENAPSGQRPVLILDSDGDIIITDLPSGLIGKAQKKLDSLNKIGGNGYLVCTEKAGGIVVDVMEITTMQSKALETIVRYFEEYGKGKPLSVAARKVLNKARERL